MKLYILTTPARKDKQARIDAALRSLQAQHNPFLTWTFVEGLDGSKPAGIASECLLAEGALPSSSWRDPVYGTVLRHGEVGCAVGHWRIWKRVADEAGENEPVAVFEDDASWDGHAFAGALEKVLAEATRQQVEHWDMMYLGRKRVNDSEEHVVSTHLRYPRYSYWTVAYLLCGANAARRLLDTRYIEHIIPVDEFMSWLYDPQAVEARVGKDILNSRAWTPPSSPAFTALACEPTLCRPLSNAFHGKSQTHLSPFIQVAEPEPELRVVTVATQNNDGLNRYRRFCRAYGLGPPVVLGLGDVWEGGNLAHGTGGGQKVLLLQSYLEATKDSDNTVLLFTDAYDVAIIGPPHQLLARFEAAACDVLFAAERYCWPDAELAARYPDCATVYRYLNSGCFIGRIGTLRRLLLKYPVLDPTYDDQLYYTHIYLKHASSDRLRLDTECTLFQCNLSDDCIKLCIDRSVVTNNSRHCEGRQPLVLHGNGGPKDKSRLNSFTNYLGVRWTHTYGFHDADADAESILELSPDAPIKVHALWWIDMSSQLQHLQKDIDALLKHGLCSRITVFCENAQVENTVRQLLAPQSYAYIHTGGVQAVIALLGQEALDTDVWWWLTTHVDVQVVAKHKLEVWTVAKQCKTKYPVFAPMCERPNTSFRNFWGDVNHDTGYYERSCDYMEIAYRRRCGVWNVPYVFMSTFFDPTLTRCAIAPFLQRDFNAAEDLDIMWCRVLREQGIYMHVDNRCSADLWKLRPEHSDDDITPNMLIAQPALIQPYWLERSTWDATCLHPDLLSFLMNNEDGTATSALPPHTEPVTDAFVFPLFTEHFCELLIKHAEHANSWSSGTRQDNSHFDPRIGNVENYPTVDVHMKQLGLEPFWKHFVIQHVIARVARCFYTGHATKDINISFVVRYDMQGQTRLAPHHDSSTYTINVALNKCGRDYEGGGVRFIRQDKTVTNLPVGYCLIHPGKLTHYHEGLPITSGKRYILVSFIL